MSLPRRQHSPAFDVVQRATEADYADMAALDRFADDVDVVTYEFENVPAETATFLSARKPVLPDPKVLATTQDRLIEKNFVQDLGIATAPFAPVDCRGRPGHAVSAIGQPAVLKTRRFGYDGKGQTMIRDGWPIRPPGRRCSAASRNPGRLRAVRARDFGGGGALAQRPDRKLRRHRERHITTTS